MDIKIKNRKAFYEFFLVERFVAGISLTGTEIKSVRQGKVSLGESYCAFKNGELYVVNMHIAEYALGTHYNHEPKRDRKLLLTKRELKKLAVKVNERGYTLIPVTMFINNKGLAKLEIALARGKRLFDKRESLKSGDARREIERRMKY